MDLHTYIVQCDKCVEVSVCHMYTGVVKGSDA